MPVEWGSHGGSDDVYLAGDLPKLGRFKIDELPLLEARNVGGQDSFPYSGDFALATELETDRGIYVQVTAGLEEMVDEQRGETAVTEVGIDVESAEKDGSEETSPWRFTGTVTPLGPPDD